MPKPSTITYISSPCAAAESPALSILIPYYCDDPSPLLSSLSSQLDGRNDVEILIYDDGTGDAQLNDNLSRMIKSSAVAITLLAASENQGRSFARNALTEHARADWVLFLDADMLPVTAHFVSDYVSLIKAETADIIFGGFEVPKSVSDPKRELHRAFSQVSDCLSLQARQERGPQYVCSSNLCVRKTVLETEGFDPGFSGWGWEDSEWAARVAGQFDLVHADIPALHLGLETTDTLLRRFKDSGANYLRFTKKHPELARTLALFNVTQKLRQVPGQAIMRPFLKLLVKLGFVPVRLRLTALKLWRASWYAEAFS